MILKFLNVIPLIIIAWSAILMVNLLPWLITVIGPWGSAAKVELSSDGEIFALPFKVGPSIMARARVLSPPKPAQVMVSTPV